MRHLLVSKPVLGLAALLLLVQMACVASSISSTATPGGSSTGSANAPKPSTSGGASTSSAPIGGAQNTQSAPATGGGSSTQAAPTSSSSGSSSTQAAPTSSSSGGQSTQSVPSTGGQATQGVPSTGGQATPADAQAMLSQVAQHYQSAGRQQALKDFSNQTAPFNNPNLFVMCIASDHKVSAMGGFPMLVGFSADNIPEVTGRSMGNVIWALATVNPQGSLPFTWKNPLTGAPEGKVMYYQKLSQDVCGVVGNTP